MTQLKALGERTTDRFRAAQQALVAMLAASENSDQNQQLEAFMALSSCFDEMRILFQILLQNKSQV
jgi:mannitol/fructose-specific phosphotransferase system IIA component (Ntr-type)